jgi:hypothetical protein
MGLSAWLRLLRQFHFRIRLSRVAMALVITFCSLVNSALALYTLLRFGRRIAKTPIDQPPVFIIGHWRSGTTYLHELMVRDRRYTYPTTYACFAPSHFLVTAWSVPRLLGFLLPRKRPMDNMAAGFDHPQEDEFALVNLGSPSPYWRLAFPNEPPCHMEFLNMQGVSEEGLRRWKRDMIWFVKALTVYQQKPLILKSPPHTGRVELLAELFPDARFIHITRDPESLFASSRNLWPSLQTAQGLQLPENEDLDEFIFDAFERMYRGFDQQRDSIQPNRICDVRYEDLVQDPIGQLERIYDHLELGDFGPVREALEEFVERQRDYKPNRHDELEPEIKAEIRRRWGGYVKRYGYSEKPAEV